MSRSAVAPPDFNPVTDALAANRLGVPSVIFFVMSAATPLTVTAGLVTTAYAITGLTGLPIAFMIIGLVLALFSVGYVAMARHSTPTGGDTTAGQELWR